MIDYETFQKIQQCCQRDGLSIAQTAAVLGLDERTVAKWSQGSYQPRRAPRRASKLDPFRTEIVRLLHQHPYTAQQILQRLREGGYTGGYSILKELVSQLRPPTTTAYLTLQFAPGQCAQVDWGSAGWLAVGATRRRLSFFVMVLAYSRRLYVEFTLAQSMEHFLACHQNGLAYFGGVTTDVMVDYVAGYIIDLLFPATICARPSKPPFKSGMERSLESHNIYKDLSHFNSSASSHQIGFR